MTRTSTPERVAVLETKVDEIRDDIRVMRDENRRDHAVVIEQIAQLRDWRNWLLGATAVLGPVLVYIATHIDWVNLVK